MSQQSATRRPLLPPKWLSLLRGGENDQLVRAAGPPALRMAGAFLQFLATLLITHSLGREKSGEFFFWSAILMSVGQVATFGLDRLALRQVPRLDGDPRAVSEFLGPIRFISLSLSILIGVLLVPYAALAQKDMDYPLAWYFLLPGCVAGVALCKINGEVMKGLGRPMMAVVYRHALSTILFLVALLIAGSRLDPEIALACFTGGFLIAGFGALAGPGFQGIGPHLRAPRQGEVREKLKEGAPICMSALFAALNYMVPLAILERCHPSETVAFLTTAYRLFMLFELLGIAIHSIAMPRLSRAAEERDWKLTHKVYLGSIRQGILLLGLPMIVSIAGAAPLMGLFGEGFGEAQSVLKTFLIFGLISLLCGPASDLILMIGHTGRMASYALAKLILTCALSFVVIPAFGALGMAAVMGAGVLLEKGLCLWHYKRHSRSL